MLGAILAILLLVSSAFALPSDGLKKRSSLCGQWDSQSVNDGYYIFYNNLWNEAQATSGSQCSNVLYNCGTEVAWITTYSWAGGHGQVKSYSEIAYLVGKELTAINTIPSSWSWSYSDASSDLVADVSYDMWLGAAATGTPSYEIMVWLSARGGALPAGSSIGTVTVADHSWTLYKGTVSTWTVYSFVTADGEITSFDNDLKLFFTYLVENQGVHNSIYVQSIDSGTEPFGGSATFTTTGYQVTVS